MRRLFSLTCYEFDMSIHRASYWIAYTLLVLFYGFTVLAPFWDGSCGAIPSQQIWHEAGHLAFIYNIFMPLLAGILSADRIQRDFHYGLAELQRSTPFADGTFILAKFMGSLMAALLPVFSVLLIQGVWMVLRGITGPGFFWPLLLAFLSISIPSHAFVVAFSLACPLVIPLRVYQVLFTGYWFWGNLISPDAFPTISDTLLNAAGQYPLQAYFKVLVDSTHDVSQAYTPSQAVLNLLLLLACSTAALLFAHGYLRRQARQT